MGLLDFIPVIGPALDAAASLVNAKQAKENYATRYQVQVADMRKAGLNPALAYGQSPGPGPTTQPLPEDLGSNTMRAIGTASAASAQRAQAENTAAQTDLLKAQRNDIIAGTALKNVLTRAQIGSVLAGTQLTTAQTATEQARPILLNLDAQLRGQDIVYARATNAVKAKMLQEQAQNYPAFQKLDLTKQEIENFLLEQQKPEAKAGAAYYSGAGQYTPYVNTALDVLKGIVGAINPVAGMFAGNSAATPMRTIPAPPATFPRQPPFPQLPKMR